MRVAAAAGKTQEVTEGQTEPYAPRDVEADQHQAQRETSRNDGHRGIYTSSGSTLKKRQMRTRKF